MIYNCQNLIDFHRKLLLMQNLVLQSSQHYRSFCSQILSAQRHTVSHRHSNESLGSITERVLLHQLTYQLNTCHYIHIPPALILQIWAFCPQLILMFHMGLRTSSSFKMLHIQYTHVCRNTYSNIRPTTYNNASIKTKQHTYKTGLHNLYVVWARLAKCGLHAGNIKFNTQHEELVSVYIHNFVYLSVHHVQ